MGLALRFNVNSAGGIVICGLLVTIGSTCLHYAVGHGAWRVVSLILNTGYADANKKNAFGFSPIMIAAISDSDSGAEYGRKQNWITGEPNVETKMAEVKLAHKGVYRELLACRTRLSIK
ncbi:hypothetical protein ACTXT7_008725 [Hymenolepis weldensis]